MALLTAKEQKYFAPVEAVHELIAVMPVQKPLGQRKGCSCPKHTEKYIFAAKLAKFII